jgi:hypothetical protein
MTYICPFCKQKMLHQPHNSRITTDDTLIVEIGDTFKCKCSLEQGGDPANGLNSWKYIDKGKWMFLVQNPKKGYGEYSYIWVNELNCVPFNKKERRAFIFR